MTTKKDDTESSVRDELVQLRADIDHLVGTVGRLANGAAGSVLQGARSTLAHAGDQATDAYEAALVEGRRALKTGEKTIKSNPYLSIAIAAGLGVLIGKLLSRPS